MWDERHVVPGVRFAVDAYVTFARTRPWVEAVASSLTELFAPDLMAERLAAFERLYTWIDPAGLAYFRARLTQAPLDSEHALEVVMEHCRTPEEQARAVAALSFKNDVLWSMLDAIDRAYAGTMERGPTEHRGPVADQPSSGATGSIGMGPGARKHVLLAPEGVLVLNQTGATILGLCDGERTVAEIVEELRGKYYSVDGDEVRNFLARLVAKRWVELGDG